MAKVVVVIDENGKEFSKEDWTIAFPCVTKASSVVEDLKRVVARANKYGEAVKIVCERGVVADIVIGELSSMIILGMREGEEKEKLMKKYGYKPEHLLATKDIEVWEIKDDQKRQVEVSEKGIEWEDEDYLSYVSKTLEISYLC